MPQLNPEFFLSQVFWLVICFSFLLIFLWKISLPRISTVLEKREKKINDNIQTAKKIQAEAKEIQAKIDQQLSKSREQVANLIKETSNNLQNNSAIAGGGVRYLREIPSFRYKLPNDNNKWVNNSATLLGHDYGSTPMRI